ncbi:MAG: AAA family ATPase, partial [Verrucomicrobiota bacterium]
MATKISFLNLKGGVGKTSLIVNVAACLAYMGRRVLVVDFDAQSNASIWLMRLDRWNILNRQPEKFILNLFQDENSSVSDMIQRNPVKGSDGEPLLNGLDLIPASFRLMDLEQELENPSEDP